MTSRHREAVAGESFSSPSVFSAAFLVACLSGSLFVIVSLRVFGGWRSSGFCAFFLLFGRGCDCRVFLSLRVRGCDCARRREFGHVGGFAM